LFQYLVYLILKIAFFPDKLKLTIELIHNLIILETGDHQNIAALKQDRVT